MKREEAIKKINEIAGKDLRKLVDLYGITVVKEGKKNKGWSGQVIEKYLGLDLSSTHVP